MAETEPTILVDPLKFFEADSVPLVSVGLVAFIEATLRRSPDEVCDEVGYLDAETPNNKKMTAALYMCSLINHRGGRSGDYIYSWLREKGVSRALLGAYAEGGTECDWRTNAHEVFAEIMKILSKDS